MAAGHSMRMISAGAAKSAPGFRPELLRPYCPTRQFAAGEVLRRKGQYYTDMFIYRRRKAKQAQGAAPPRKS